MKRSLLLLTAATCLFSASRAASPYGGIFDNEAHLITAASEFITLRKAGDKLWFEIPVRLMGREMLMGSTLADISSERFGNAGYKQHDPLHIRFSLTNSTLHLRRINVGITTDYLSEALKKVNVDPIFASFPVAAWGPDSTSVVIETGDFFLDNPQYFDFMPTDAVKYDATLKRESSYLGGIKAFDDNLSVESNLTFMVSAGTGDEMMAAGDPVTARVTRSILLLPEDKMTPRISDSRVGLYNTMKIRYAARDEGSKIYSVAHRWRVIPSDVEAYARGELVEPVKKIVWYIDPTFPEGWKVPIKRAVENWNAAFEAIGFRNVLEARPFPTPEQDPEFDPDNLKYSCIRFLPSIVSNAMGPSWVDPTTGEIINASVLVWSDIAKLVNMWRFVQTAQVDPRVRTKKLPDDVLHESLQYVISHEVGHTLGFLHSMASSHAWPVDSLRSATFTQRYGTTPSIMDYARFNYIAQPGDTGVGLMPPYIGVYDRFLIKWAYQYVPGVLDEWDEAPVVETWVDAVAGDPVYRYGRQQLASRYDPSAIEEDLGDDPIRAGDYGIANLKYILPRLEGWISDDSDYEHRRTLYDEIWNQYLRYVRNVMLNIGGIYLTEVKEGTPGQHIVPVPRHIQKNSLSWVMAQYRDMEWLDEPSLRRNFALGVNGAPQMREMIAGSLRAQIAGVVLSSHYAGYADTGARSAYTTGEFMEDLYHETWKHVRRNRHALSHGERLLHKTMVDIFCGPLTTGSGSPATAQTEGESGANGVARYAGAPGIEDILAYGLDESGIVERYADLFRRHESRHGHGSVATLLSGGGNDFGPAGIGLQGPVDISAIDDSGDWLIELAIRSRYLLERVVRHTRGGTRAHYLALLTTLNAALKDKL